MHISNADLLVLYPVLHTVLFLDLLLAQKGILSIVSFLHLFFSYLNININFLHLICNYILKYKSFRAYDSTIFFLLSIPTFYYG